MCLEIGDFEVSESESNPESFCTATSSIGGELAKYVFCAIVIALVSFYCRMQEPTFFVCYLVIKNERCRQCNESMRTIENISPYWYVLQNETRF